MDFELTQDQDLLVTTLRRFVAERVIPEARRFDERGQVPRPLFGALGELGLLGAGDPDSGLGRLELVLVLEELAKGSGGLGLAVLTHTVLGVGLLARSGGDAKRVWLQKLATGEALATSDALFTGMGRLQITPSPEGAALEGATAPLPLAADADLFVLRDGDGAWLALPGKSEPEAMLGARAAGFGRLVLHGVRLPKAARLVVDWSALESELVLGAAAVALGLGEAALVAARNYAPERKQFGQPIADFQAIQWKLADMATELSAARLLVRAAAVGVATSAQAKLAAEGAAMRAADEAIQIHGGVGFTREYAPERLYRDAKLVAQVAGATDVQRERVARSVLEAT